MRLSAAVEGTSTWYAWPWSVFTVSVLPPMAVIVPTNREGVCAPASTAPASRAIDTATCANLWGNRIFILFFINQFSTGLYLSVSGIGNIISVPVDEPSRQKVEQAIPQCAGLLENRWIPVQKSIFLEFAESRTLSQAEGRCRSTPHAPPSPERNSTTRRGNRRAARPCCVPRPYPCPREERQAE